MLFQEKVKNVFDKRTKADEFQIRDLVFKWDSKNEENSKCYTHFSSSTCYENQTSEFASNPQVVNLNLG